MHDSYDDVRPKVARDASSGHVSRNAGKPLHLRRQNAHLVAGVQSDPGVGLKPAADRSRSQVG